jgi:HD superfamily phosphodiesterase
VARYAEKIGKEERGNLAVILTAAYLHDIGIKESERKYQSTAARYQEEEGPPVARDILERLGAKTELVDEACDIVGHHHHPRPEETTNFKCIYDADLLTNMEEEQKESPTDPDKLAKRVNDLFLTASGKKLAEEVLLRPVAR